MNDQPKISVIVAVYKAENYLTRCVDSLLCQTFQDFELLLIDDGSPDSSGVLCDCYAEKDNRVRTFHNENKGVSATRQFGIENAKGIYSIHVDPDDWVSPNMLEMLYQTALKDNVDLVICDYFEVHRSKVKYVIQKPTSLFHGDVLKDLFRTLHGSCWNKLIRLSCYTKYEVHFPVGINYCEDLYTWLLLLQNPLKITYLDSAFYYYDRSTNANSITIRYRSTAYQREKIFFDNLSLILNKDLYASELLIMQSRLAFAAIVCGKLSQLEYTEQFHNLKNASVFGTSWNKLCIKLALSGNLSLAEFIVSFRHFFSHAKKAVLRLYEFLYENFSFKL